MDSTSSGSNLHLRHNSSLRNASSINLFGASSNGSIASEKRTGKAHIPPPEAPEQSRVGIRVQRNPSALQDHFKRFSVDERATVANPVENGRRHYPAARSVFRESAQPEVHRRQQPLRAAPWAEMPSSRLRPKIVPQASTVIGFRRKTVAGHQLGQESQPSKPLEAKRHMSFNANTESRPKEAPVRDPSKPVPARYRCTPNILRFSPRISTLTPRRKVAGQRTGFLNWMDVTEKPKVQRFVKPAPDPAAPPQRACLDPPKHRARKHVSPRHAPGETVFSELAPKWHPGKKPSAAQLKPSGGDHLTSKRIGPAQKQHHATPWATSYERSPFDPGSSRVKPFAAQRARHIDPALK